ncbi:hypothetical protein MA16_Dca008726 [Dendrobium catenatum]|uniref:Uncharacterized protein n=1 Tax=Dendrobium catenatum TaxID=906689 RepID=A0A2I0W4M2_9ASPA|nr:hypothetical protein MA16_Dca008726 [Dendrobium catenatum]
MGYCTVPSESFNDGQISAGDNYKWIYVSPEFPMLQNLYSIETSLVSHYFALVIYHYYLPDRLIPQCSVSVVHILASLSESGNPNLLFTIVCHVEALGYSLTPQLDVEINTVGDEIILKYLPEAAACSSTGAQDSSSWHALKERIKHLQARARDGWHYPLISTFLGAMESDLEDDEPPLGYW